MGADTEETILGFLAAAEFTGFAELAGCLDQAPEMADRVHLAHIVTGVFAGYQQLADRLHATGGDPLAQLEAFTTPLAAFAARTEPHDWPEAMAKAYTLAALSSDICAATADRFSTETRSILVDRAEQRPLVEFTHAAVTRSLRDHPDLHSRLSLYTRRLVGELLSQTHRVAADKPEVVQFLRSDSSDHTWAGLTTLLAEPLAAHGERMQQLGLAP